MDPITLSALIGAGAMTGNSLLSKLLNPIQSQYPQAQPLNLGQTFMSAGGTMPSNMNLYPKQPSTMQPGSLLGNSGYGGNQFLQYLMSRR